MQGNFVSNASNSVKWQRYAGGVAANVARAAQRIYDIHIPGKKVDFHTAVGVDVAGDCIVQCIADLGLSLHTHRIEGQTTGRYSVVLDKYGELLIGLADVSIVEYLKAEQILSYLDTDRHGLLFMDANLSTGCINRLIDKAKQHSMLVAMVCVSPLKALKLLRHVHQIDLIFCNRREALAMAIETKLISEDTGADEATAAHLADLLGAIGFTSYVLTDGRQPVFICEYGELSRIAVPSISMSHNVNGAGDALAGATLAAMTLDISLSTAVSDYGLPMAAEVLIGKHLPPAMV